MRSVPAAGRITLPGASGAATLAPCLSLYLDAFRFLAAAAVLVHHVVVYPFAREAPHSGGNWHDVAGAYGSVAVIAFFVLSGYVIAHVTAARETSAGAYAVSRVSRLYSVILPALLLTWGCDTLGQSLAPEFYGNPHVLWKPPTAEGYLASMFLVSEYQAFGFGGIVPGTNAPFWSLSFEAAYYVLAGLALFAPRRVAVIAGILVLAVAGRTIAALSVCWIAGFGLYRLQSRAAFTLPAPWAVAVISAVALVAWPQLWHEGPREYRGLSFPWGRGPFKRDLVLDAGTTLAVVAHLAAMRPCLTERRALSVGLTRTVRWLGSLTFPLYAMHYPVICLVAAISPWRRDSWAQLVALAGVPLIVAAALTPGCEALKGWLRQRLAGWGLR